MQEEEPGEEEKVKIALCQWDLAWEDGAANIRRLEQLLDGLEAVDLIVLPELWPCGFTMNRQAHRHGPAAAHFMEETARLRGCFVMGGLPVCYGEEQFNRALCFCPDGLVGAPYSKIQLFRLAGEHNAYRRGRETRVWPLGSTQVSPFICYDLRFPELARRCALYSQVLIYMANWPGTRIAHWHQLILARAIENQCFVAGVNRTGVDGNGLAYPGHSMVVDPLGNVLCQADEKEGVSVVDLDLAQVEEVRSRLPFLADFEPRTVSTEPSGQEFKRGNGA